MSSSPIFHENQGLNVERRSGSREPLKWVVLVYFGQDNWGKLVDLSERGMRFEFAQPPSDRERINFTFEAMGRLPASFGGEIISDSFQAAGDVRWTRDFERTAGVQFVNLAVGSCEQIRKWLSFGDSADSGPSSNKTEPEAVEPEAPVSLPEPFEPPPAHPETLPELNQDEMRLEAACANPSAEPRADSLVNPASPFVAETIETLFFENCSQAMAEQENKNDEPSSSSLRMSRMQSLAVTAVVTVIAVLAGIRMILPRLAPGVHAVAPISGPSVGKSERIVSEYDTSAGSPRPFLVEVWDAYNRRWLLRFDSDSSENAPTQAAYRTTLPPSTASLRGASHAKQPAVSAKPAAPQRFTMIVPKVNQFGTNHSAMNSLSTVAPVVSDEWHAPLEAPIASILASHAIPSPPAAPAPVGGQVQPARLLKSVRPDYPPIARSSHAGGEVTVDALIDANGNVTDLKAVSGPSILRQAALDAVRQWKYDPARLDGRPAAMHLTLTVKFHAE